MFDDTAGMLPRISMSSSSLSSSFEALPELPAGLRTFDSAAETSFHGSFSEADRQIGPLMTRKSEHRRARARRQSDKEAFERRHTQNWQQLQPWLLNKARAARTS